MERLKSGLIDRRLAGLPADEQLKCSVKKFYALKLGEIYTGC
jgi:hypothetical protein